MRLIIDYPWYFIVLCLLTGVVYATLLYYVGYKRNRSNSLGRGVTMLFALLRTLAVSAITFLLLAPQVKRTTGRKEKPIVIIAEDNSSSLRYCKDSAFYSTGFQTDIDNLQKSLGDAFEVHRLRYGSAVREKEEDDSLFADGLTDMGRLIDDVAERYYRRNLGALVVTGDGICNSGGSPLTAAERLSIPVYCVAMGDTTVYRDASVANVRCNRMAYLGNSFPMEITVGASHMSGETATLNVSRDGKRIFSKQIKIDGHRFTATESLMIEADREGVNSYDVELLPLSDERTLRNNRRAVAVEVIDGHQKVAIIAAVPHPDVAALRASLESNSNYEVEFFLSKDFKGDAGDYSLLVLHQLPSKANELDVQKLLASGTPAIFVIGTQTDLARLNALHAGLEIYSRIERQNEVTALFDKDFTFFTYDRASGERIGHYPPLLSPFGEYKLSGNAQSLFTSRIGTVNSGQPLVAMSQREGVRYTFVAGEGLWRWRMADYQQNGSHSEFDGLMGKIAVFTALRADKERFHVRVKSLFGENEDVLLEAELYNDNYEVVNTPEVQLAINTQGDNQSRRYTFNRNGSGYGINLGPLSPGRYTYHASTTFNGRNYSSSGLFVVEDFNLEAVNTVADHSLLATLAAATGGAMVDAREVERVGELLRERDDIHTVVFSETNYNDMLNMPLILIAVIMLLAIEWVSRKYSGEV